MTKEIKQGPFEDFDELTSNARKSWVKSKGTMGHDSYYRLVKLNGNPFPSHNEMYIEIQVFPNYGESIVSFGRNSFGGETFGQTTYFKDREYEHREKDPTSRSDFKYLALEVIKEIIDLAEEVEEVNVLIAEPFTGRKSTYEERALEERLRSMKK
ncbi:hypothetical protein CL617_05380 [archaeon]|nr:hypothetical protein [archaeon]|tara:strand:- start:766 stop:1230 length:465 start_codon:yes stop_codon:yes gene_type:complete